MPGHTVDTGHGYRVCHASGYLDEDTPPVALCGQKGAVLLLVDPQRYGPDGVTCRRCRKLLQEDL